jgi:hypothetical membrane protein
MFLIVLIGAMWPGYSLVANYMSELGGVDSPFKNIMNVFGFMALGIFLILFSFGLKFSLKKNIYSQLVFICSLIAGIFMVLVGFFPCDTGCNNVTLIGRLHTWTSIPPSIFLPSAAILSAPALVMASNKGPSNKSGYWKKWAFVFFWLGMLSFASGTLSTFPSTQPYIGLIQRLGITTSLIWVSLISFVLLKQEDRPRQV